MMSIHLSTFVFSLTVKSIFGLSFVHVQQLSYLHSHGVDAVREGLELLGDTFFSERGYASIVALRDDVAMSEFIKRLLAREDKFVPQDQEGDFRAFVPWFSGTKATQTFTQMRQELMGKSWVKDLKAIDGDSLTESDYQAVAARHNDTAMNLIARAVLQSDGRFVPSNLVHELAGFVPWFSGTKAVQNLEQMRSELHDKPWVRMLNAAHGPTAVGAKTSHEEARKSKETSLLMAESTAEMQSQQQSEETPSRMGADEVKDRLLKELSIEETPRDVQRPSSEMQGQQRSEKTPGRTGADEAANRPVTVRSAEDVRNPECRSCIVWGEATVLSFNAYQDRFRVHPDRVVELSARHNTKDQHSVVEAGTYWLIKNQHVQIQGRYWKYNKTKVGLGLGAIAVGGPLVGYNTLLIRSLSGPVTWNGMAILSGAPSSFSTEWFEAEYVSDAGPVAGDTHVPGFKFTFANGLRMTVARYRHKLSARIVACDSNTGVDSSQGQCGNLDRKPHRTSSSWLALQKAAKKLLPADIIFPDGHGWQQHKQLKQL